ncbi:MAG TPA: ABC transporter permease [Herpetosiphonaceae bacterium]
MQYLINNFDVVRMRFGEHLRLTLIALAIALVIALPLGVLLSRVKWLEGPVMSVLNLLYTIPSLALLVLLVPFTGLGADTAIIVLVVYAQVILVRNIVVGLNGVSPDIVEAARGMGMNGWQRFFRVELPLALPVIIAGVRIATVTIIAIATVAALINAGGLGRILFEGVSRRSESRIIAGSLAAAAMAAMANVLLRLLEWRATRAIRGDEA